MPYMSVVVPTYNRQETIEKCLKAIRKSAYQDYELIVVDSGSQDATGSIAKKYADRVIEVKEKIGSYHARNRGMESSLGEIIVNIDSDVVIEPDSLTKIYNYFSKHKEIDAVTGLISEKHPNLNFFSQYKNLYMHYIFSKLPERVTFLYGSIHAIRRQAIQPYDSYIEIADDLALGQKLVSCGKQIAFLKDLEVIHLKRYGLLSFIKNDFQIPFDWAKIFITHKGWRQLGKNKTGYAHSPKEQLISVVLAPVILLFSLGTLLGYFYAPLLSFLILVWFLLNLCFLTYLANKRGLFFATSAILVTFFDNIVMALGILGGLPYS